MGEFSTVTVECDLPDTAPEWLKAYPVFQTYDLGGYGEYAITKDRQLVIVDTIVGSMLREALSITDMPPRQPIQYKRKKIQLYASNIRAGRKVGRVYRSFTEDGSPSVKLIYTVWIYDGKVGKMRETMRKEDKALPMFEF